MQTAKRIIKLTHMNFQLDLKDLVDDVWTDSGANSSVVQVVLISESRQLQATLNTFGIQVNRHQKSIFLHISNDTFIECDHLVISFFQFRLRHLVK